MKWSSRQSIGFFQRNSTSGMEILVFDRAFGNFCTCNRAFLRGCLSTSLYTLSGGPIDITAMQTLDPNASLAMMYRRQQSPVQIMKIHPSISSCCMFPSPYCIQIRRAVTAQAVLFTTNTPTSIPSLAASNSAYGLSFTPSHTSRTRSDAVTSSMSPETFNLCGNMSPLLK